MTNLGVMASNALEREIMSKSQALGSVILELVGASDANLELFLKIAQAVNKRNVDADLRAQALTKALTIPVISPSNILTVDDTLLAELIVLGQYVYINNNIVEYKYLTATKDGDEGQESVFPHDPSENGRWKWMFWSPSRWVSTEEVRDAVEREGFALAKARQLAAFGIAHPDHQLSGPIIGLGSVCRVGGRSCSPGRWCGGGECRLSLYDLSDGWGPNYRFLCVKPVDSSA